MSSTGDGYRLNYESVQFSFQERDVFWPNRAQGQPRYLTVKSNLLLAAGEKDAYCSGAPIICPYDVYGATRDVAKKMVNTPGKAILINNTGHSIHSERPAFLATQIVNFLEQVGLNPGTPASLFGVSTGSPRGGNIVTVGASGTILSSTNGTAWASQNSNVAVNLTAVAWFPGFEGVASQFVAVGDGGTIITSPDGSVWTPRITTQSWEEFTGVASGQGISVVTSASAPSVYTSTDGVNWTLRGNVAPQPLLGIGWGSRASWSVVELTGWSCISIICFSVREGTRSSIGCRLIDRPGRH
jgi:hypothetical protein